MDAISASIQFETFSLGGKKKVKTILCFVFCAIDTMRYSHFSNFLNIPRLSLPEFYTVALSLA